MNHDQFIDWKYNNKSLIDIKLENLNIQRYKQIEKKDEEKNKELPFDANSNLLIIPL